MLEYISENGLVLVPVLNVIGMIIKNTEKIPDKYIPIILLFFGVVGALAVMGVSAHSVVQGVLITGTAVYGNQLVKQLKE